MQETAAPISSPAGSAWGAFDVWDFYDPDKARRIACRVPSKFLHLVFSEGTRRVEILKLNEIRGIVEFVLYGPIADSAMENGRREGEAGFEYECLSAKFALYRTDIPLLETEADRDRFVERLVALAAEDAPLERVLRALGLRRI